MDSYLSYLGFYLSYLENFWENSFKLNHVCVRVRWCIWRYHHDEDGIGDILVLEVILVKHYTEATLLNIIQGLH